MTIKRMLIAASIIVVLTSIFYFGLMDDYQRFLTYIADFKDKLSFEILILVGIVHILLISIPFFPGVELGFLLIFLFGRVGIVFVYFFTFLGLLLAFFIGRHMHNSFLTSWLNRKQMEADLDSRKTAMESDDEKNSHQTKPLVWLNKAKKFISHNQYIFIALLINLPANSIIGGGGGIAFLCGLNRQVELKKFILTVLLAISPLPILLFFGLVQIESLLGGIK